jgi:hypothetical protein
MADKRDPTLTPAFCPWCGGRSLTLRKMMPLGWWEVMCDDGCQRICIVADDHQVLR